MLYDKLKANKKIPFHMPGHKRNVELLGRKLPYDIDITEIYGFDNLHNPEGVIKQIEKKAKNVYKSENSFLLVNGSTVGILTAVNTVVNCGDTVLMARNCHKSVYNAVEISGAKPEYIVSENDEYGIFKAIDTDIFAERLEKTAPKLVVITSPTYEGVCSDIEKICELAHSKKIPVLLDAAHGAHNIKLACSADIVIMSLHKTLPALTQCAIAHINSALVNAEEFRVNLSVFETSSPSYVLMASIDECLDYLTNNSRQELFLRKRQQLLSDLSSLNKLRVINYNDITKLVVFCGYSDITGVELADILRNKYNIEVEMACKSYIVLILTSCDDFNNYKIITDALISTDSSISYNNYTPEPSIPLPEKAGDIYTGKELVPLEMAEGRASAEYIWAYPPGIPLITPGEIVSGNLIDYISESSENGVNIQSTYKKLPEKIYCQS